MVTHPSRFDAGKKYQRVLFADEERHAHSHDFNEMQQIVEHRIKSVADTLMGDGDVIDGCEIVIDATTGGVRLGAGKIYAAGIVHDVAAATLTVPVTGTVVIGISVVTDVVTYLTDANLKGQAAGTHAYGEPGEDRLRVVATWARDTGQGQFFPVYRIVDGVVLTQTPPPALEPVNAALARYDRENNGHYIVSGWHVTPRGIMAGKQRFEIEEGTINVHGFKLDRLASYPLLLTEEPDLDEVEAEPHVVPSGHTSSNPLEIVLNRGPIASVLSVTILKQVTETITHGPYSGISDALANTSVAEVLSVTQGGTTYAASTSYTLVQDRIDWSPAGPEPSPGSTYQVTYRYLDIDTPQSVGRQSITITGATPGSTVLVRYTWKLPRIDVITVDRYGNIGYIYGHSSRYTPRPPAVPADIFAIAEVTNRWELTPDVRNTTTRAVLTNRLQQFGTLIDDLFDLVAQERLRRDMDRREVTAKRGVFVDPFLDDDMRDAGVAQTAAISGASLRLPISVSVEERTMGTEPMLLPYADEIVIDQPLRTGALKINEYQVFEPMPPSIELTPAVDFWTEAASEWTSDLTRVFLDATALAGTTVQSQELEVASRRLDTAQSLRVRNVDYRITGFGAGEVLARLEFDGVNITPAPAKVADANGVVTGTFAIPAGLSAGTKRVRAEGASGGPAAFGTYVGSGQVEVAVMRNVFTTVVGTRVDPPAVIEPVIPAPAETPPIEEWVAPLPQRNGGTRWDPLAQSIVLASGRHVTSVAVWIDAIGSPSNPVVIQLREMRLGVPAAVVMAEALMPMSGRTPGQWVTVPFRVPVFVPDDLEVAVVFLTDDGNHKLGVAELGEYDAARQQWVTSQPYSVGVLFSSSNASTWTPHQKSDLTFRMRAARFQMPTRTIDAGNFVLTACTDLIVRAFAELPAADTSVRVLITRANGEQINAAIGQPMQFAEAVTETVNVKFILRGTPEHSPLLYPFVTLIKGSQAASGTYVTRAMPAGAGSRVLVTCDALLPSGSSLAVGVGQTTFASAVIKSAAPLGDGWTEITYELAAYAAADARARLTLTGTPAARPQVRNLRALVTAAP